MFRKGKFINDLHKLLEQALDKYFAQMCKINMLTLNPL